MYYEGLDNTCTALQLCSWSILYFSNKDMRENPYDLNLKVLGKLEEIRAEGAHLDFALIFATVTGEQLGVMCKSDEKYHFNARLLLDILGFEEVFVGKKDFDEDRQRHQESGDVYMFCISPYVLKENLDKMIPHYQNLVKEGEMEHRAKFPLFRLQDLKDIGAVPPGTSVKEPITKYYTTLFSRNQLRALIKDKFGYPLTAIPEGWTFEKLKTCQNAWQKGEDV